MKLSLSQLRRGVLLALLAPAFPLLHGAPHSSDNGINDAPKDPELGAPAPRFTYFRKINLSGSIDLLTALGTGRGVNPSSGLDFTLRLDPKLFDNLLHDHFDLYVRMRYRRRIGDLAPSGLGEVMGAAWGVVDGFTNGGFEVPEFFFRHRFPKPHLELRYGQMVIDSQFDAQPVGGSKSAFLNRAFASNPTVAFPRLGAGITMHWDPDNRWDLLFGITSVQGSNSKNQIDFKFASANLFKIIQLGYDLSSPDSDSGPRRIQWLAWHADAIPDALLEEGSGSSITYDHQFGWLSSETFVRLAWARGGATDAQFLLVGGLADDITPVGRIGFGLGIGRGTEPDHWQGVAEAFYRHKIGTHGGFNFNFQLLGGQGFRDSGSLRMVFATGFRFFF